MVFPNNMVFRYYVKPERKECFELFSGDKSFNMSVTQDLGQCLVDLYYYTDSTYAKSVTTEIIKILNPMSLDKRDKDDTAWEKIMDLARHLLSVHPFYWLFFQLLSDLEMEICEEDFDAITIVDFIPDVKENTRNILDLFENELEGAVEGARTLIEKCLDDRYKPNYTTAERFHELCRDWNVNYIFYSVLRTEEIMLDYSGHEDLSRLSVDRLRQNNIKLSFREVLYPQSIQEIYNYIKAYCLRLPLPVHKCKNCGRYFPVTGNITQDYCNRTIEGSDKTCRQMGAVLQYQQRQMQHPAKKEFSRSYKAHNARVRYGTLSKEDFTAWSKVAREKRDACVAGELSLEDFVAWLDRDKQR